MLFENIWFVNNKLFIVWDFWKYRIWIRLQENSTKWKEYIFWKEEVFRLNCAAV